MLHIVNLRKSSNAAQLKHCKVKVVHVSLVKMFFSFENSQVNYLKID